MIKKLKISSICHDLALHYDVKMPLFHFLTFQRTESSGVIRWMMEWHMFCEGSTNRTVSGKRFYKSILRKSFAKDRLIEPARETVL